MKKFLLMMMLISTVIFADDIFISPKNGDSIKNTLTIQFDPRHTDVDIDVLICDENIKAVWRDKLTPKNNYTIIIDVSKFKKGKYLIHAEYHIEEEIFGSYAEFWIE